MKSENTDASSQAEKPKGMFNLIEKGITHLLFVVIRVCRT